MEDAKEVEEKAGLRSDDKIRELHRRGAEHAGKKSGNTGDREGPKVTENGSRRRAGGASLRDDSSVKGQASKWVNTIRSR